VILIDTNILIYATVPGFAEHAHAFRILNEISSGSEHYGLTWVNIFEYLRAVTHRAMVKPRPFPLTEALANIRELLDHPLFARIDPGPQHLKIFEKVCKEAGHVEGNFVHDCRIAAIMRENGVERILTRDTEFRRIPGIRVVDPFQLESDLQPDRG
jgi:uncharacterized protein